MTAHVNSRRFGVNLNFSALHNGSEQALRLRQAGLAE